MRRVGYEAVELFARNNTYGEVLLRQALIHKATLQIHIVEEEILVEVFVVANSCCRSLSYLCRHLRIDLATLALEHRRTGVLWA